MGFRDGVLLATLTGCNPYPSHPADSEESKDSKVFDSDTGSDSDTDPSRDSDTGPVGDSDTAQPMDSGTELVLGVDDAAKLIGQDATGAYRGLAVAGGADISGDGSLDIVVTQAKAEATGVAGSGVVYVYSGAPTGRVYLDDLSSTYWGPEEGYAGSTVAMGGDIDGDGFDDLLVGAPSWDDSDEEWGTPGAVFVVFGPVDGGGSLPENGQMIEGEHIFENWTGANLFGWGLAAAGDTNDDGFDDFLVGATEYNDWGRNYLFTGPLTSAPTAADAGAVIDGIEGHSTELAIAGAGDTDGDGLPDLLLAKGGTNGSGASLFLSPVVGSLTTDDSDANLNDRSDTSGGASLASSADGDGDGYADVLLGAPALLGNDIGGAYLVSGPIAGEFDLAGSTAILYSDHEDGAAGVSVASAGDVNADGFDDFLIGACDIEPDAPGATYVVFGPAVGSVDLGVADVVIHGEGGDDQSGLMLAPAGDIDGDGLADILTGGPGDDDGGEDAGAVWLVLGSTMR